MPPQQALPPKAEVLRTQGREIFTCRRTAEGISPADLQAASQAPAQALPLNPPPQGHLHDLAVMLSRVNLAPFGNRRAGLFCFVAWAYGRESMV